MNCVTVKFTYQGETLEIECSRDEYIKDIIKKYFTKLNILQSFRKKSKMHIIYIMVQL